MACVPGDPFFNSVVLLCHFDGTNGQTTFTDNSNSAHALTANNGAQVATSNPKFGTGSLLNQIGPSSSVSCPASTDFSFPGQFTVEGWGFATSFSSSLGLVLISTWAHAWYLGFNGAQGLVFLYSTDGSNVLHVGAPYTPALNTWIFFAADRDASNVIRVYANGAVIASGTETNALWYSGDILRIGNDNGSDGWPGNIDDIRVTKGVARYGGAFTPPTVPFPNQLGSIGCGGGFFHGSFSEIRFPSPTLIAAMAGTRAIMRNKRTTRRGLLRSLGGGG